MSQRTAIIEEFDDDTDLPLPNVPLPNTGARGPLLEEINSDDEYDLSSQKAGPASQSTGHSYYEPPIPEGKSVKDITPYKKWSCIYPIYLDAKRPYGTGQRRVCRAKSLWWPLSKDIAEAAGRLGLGTLHEISKAHPRDWENPGRVRVQWKKDGKLMNINIKTKKQLLESICFQIQLAKPENIPKEPYITTPPVNTAKAASPIPPSSAAKGKQSATTKSKSPSAPTHHSRLPIPPEPLPSLSTRVSPYSPAISTGILVDAVKAGMEANSQVAPAPGIPGSGVQKGKRKVVRVRG